MIENFLFRRLIAIYLGVGLDILIGDPYFFYHPVRLMGTIINLEENLIRKIFNSPGLLKLGGLVMVAINIGLGLGLGLAISRIQGGLGFFVEVLIYYFFISARMLDYEASMVKKSLSISLEKGRDRLSYIVGRDTKDLDEKSIIRATIETVAENTSDGVIGPILYGGVFGPTGIIVYKFINTMDSMIGYKNDKYIDLGRYAALTDDLANLIPARLTGLLMCLSELRPTKIYKSLRIMLRDRKNHQGPNPAYPEGACAAILNIQLGGPSYYGSRLVQKPYIGDDIEDPTTYHIDQAIELMYKTLALFLIFFTLIVLY